VIRLTLTKTLEKEVDAERPPMDRSNKLMVVDKLERELAGIAKERNSSDNDLQPSFDDLSRGLNADRHATTLADLNHRLLSIDERLGHIQENTSTKIMPDYFLNAIKASTKATEDRARDIQGNVFLISLIVIFWSAFYSWKNYDDLRTFLQASTNFVYVLFKAAANFISQLFS
jgi:hypothetical protein